MKYWIYDIGSDITRGPASDEQIARWEKGERRLIINYHGCPTKVELRLREDWNHQVKMSAPILAPPAPPLRRTLSGHIATADIIVTIQS